MMTEAHAHVGALGEWLSMPDLAACTGIECCLDTLGAASRDGAGWVRGVGARVAGWSEQRWPTIEEMDRACPDHPCVLMSFDLHAACANSAALQAAGLAPGVAVGANGLVVQDERTGEPTGLLLEDAAHAVWRAAPEPDQQTRREFARLGAASLASLGYHEVHDMHAPAWLAEALVDLEASGELALRVALYAPWQELESGAFPEVRAERVRLVGGKVFVDGTLNSRTALMLQPYSDPIAGMERGQQMLTSADLDRAYRVCESRGIHLACHAIGDGAVRCVLDAIERVRPSVPGQRIEHAELIDERDVARFVQLGVVASVQPCHLLADIEALRQHVGGRLDRVLPLRELVDAGCEPGNLAGPGLVFGSDAPVVRADPSDSIQAATRRRRRAMDEHEAIAIEQAIDEGTARRAFGGSLWA